MPGSNMSKFSVVGMLCAALLATTRTQAATLYVSVNGTDDGGVNNCTVMQDPCASIQTAIDFAGAGDTVHIGAGVYEENIRFGNGMEPNTAVGITLQGATATNEDGTMKMTTVIQATNSTVPRPAGVDASIVVDVWSANVTLQHLVLAQGTDVTSEVATARDIGVFVGPPSTDFTLSECIIRRQRTGEPTMPGSRGILVFRATGSVIADSMFQGPYQDHIHNPTSLGVVRDNTVYEATRLGIVLVQETESSDTTGNVIQGNMVEACASDGIQIQGDQNVVRDNVVLDNRGAGIKLCGINATGDCVNPFDAWSEATENLVENNRLDNNGAGDIVDNGSNNTVLGTPETDETAAPTMTPVTSSPTSSPMGQDSTGPTAMPTNLPTSQATIIPSFAAAVMIIMALPLML